MTTAKPLHLRLFLEGEEVPVVSAYIDFGLTRPATANIEIIPVDEAIDLQPRTMVHLFYYDDTRSEGEESTYSDIGIYRLIFSGEAIGFSVVKNNRARSLILQCIDFSGYFSAAHATTINANGPDNNLISDHAYLYGGSRSIFDSLVQNQAERLVEWLGQTPITPGLTSVTGVAGGIIRILEVMGGVYGPHDRDTVREKGVNDFFTMAELRCRIMQQICAEEKDETSKNLLSGKVFMEWLSNNLQSQGTQITIQDIIVLLAKYIEYGFVPNPAAKYEVRKEGGTGAVVTTAKSVSETKDGSSALADLKTFQDDLSLFSREIPLREDSKGILRDKSVYLDKATSSLDTLRAENPQIDSEVVSVLNEILIVNSSMKDFENLSNLKVSESLTRLSSAIDLLNSIRTSVYSERTEADVFSQRLRSIIFRPDCWFAAPPKCNVLFPEMYSNLTYDRNWVGEVSRSLITTFSAMVGVDRTDIINSHIFVPPAKYTDAALQSDDEPKENNVDRSSYAKLMNHELHTGIVPATKWIPDTMAGTPDSKDDTDTPSEDARLDWAQKASLFHFFKDRFSPRSASISGRFNPNLVCGFPAAIVLSPIIPKDGSVSQNVDELLEKLGGKIPYQLVGQVIGVQHSIDQNGGSTNISMTHVRRHTGLDDVLLNLKYVDKGKEVARIVSYGISFEEAIDDKDLFDMLSGCTPQGDVPINEATFSSPTDLSTTAVMSTVDPETGRQASAFVSETRSSSYEYSVSGKDVSLYTKKASIPEAEQYDILVPKGLTSVSVGSNGIKGGKVLGVRVNDADRQGLNGKMVFRSITVFERIVVTLDSSPPFEDLMRPAWMSSSFQNEKITDNVYMPFFGCGSVVDQLTVEGATSDGSLLGMEGASPGVLEVSNKDSAQSITSSINKAASVRAKNSVDRAVTWLSYLYGAVRSSSTIAKDVEKFVSDYTRRPIATIDQILGSRDLELQISGSKVSAASGSIGFHTMAVNPAVVDASATSRLVGLIEDPTVPLPRLDLSGDSQPIDPRYDVRYEKKKSVREYKEALQLGRGFRG